VLYIGIYPQYCIENISTQKKQDPIQQYCIENISTQKKQDPIQEEALISIPGWRWHTIHLVN
jgi:hypothetical protein